MAALLALLSSLLWGSADFLGGTAARRRPALLVVAISQAFGLSAVLVLALLTRPWQHVRGHGFLVPALIAGVISLVALSSFYRGLATGRMGVVAAISSMGVAVPVAVGLVRGDRPTAITALGIVVAALGAAAASGPELRGGVGVRPILLAVVAAIGFGSVLVALDAGADSNVTLTLLVMRATTVALLLPVIVRHLGTGDDDTGSVRALAVLAAVGLADVSANACYAVATTKGLLTVVAVLGSIYPAVTVVLARTIHSERLSRLQTAGVVGTLLGVVLIASGGSS